METTKLQTEKSVHGLLTKLTVPTKYKKLHADAVTPTYATDGSAAFDLYNVEDTTWNPNETKLVRTGLSFEVPYGYFLAVVPRSSTGLKTPLRQSNSFGVVDSDYRGEVQLLLTNSSSEVYSVNKHSRLCQGFLLPVLYAQLTEVSELSETLRGSGGFGSTGV